MPNNIVNQLIKAVADLHDEVVKLKNDNIWLKRGIIGIISSLVAVFTAVVAGICLK